MTAEPESFDVVVAGAGLVGLSLSAALGQNGLRVALVDRAPVTWSEADPATWDARIYAISPGSAAFLRRTGAWQRLSCDRVSAIESMHVCGDTGSVLDFSAYELGERALAWIVEERALRAALLPQVHAAGVDVRGGVTFAQLEWTATHGTLTLDDGAALKAQLIVAADGVRSWVREAAGLHGEPRSYEQSGVVANFAIERAHHGIACQWFLRDGGVLAWLPLPGRRISIVWSAPTALAQRLVALPANELAAEVEEAGNHRFGGMTLLTAPQSFPLSLLKLPTPIAHRLALVGDAAHGVHPLAGQGVNLGFGDANALASVLATRGPVSDPGAPLLLMRYARKRAEPVLAMQAVTDGLARLFGNRSPWLRGLRNAGMAAVDRLPALKRALAQPALR